MNLINTLSRNRQSVFCVVMCMDPMPDLGGFYAAKC